MPTALKDLIGKRFNRFVVIGTNMGKYQMELLCRYDCGTIKSLTHRTLKIGTTKSCGCYNKEVLSKRAIHGQCNKTVEYKSWSHMKDRCSNPNNADYHNYGGRGIKVCKRWLKFENFFLDMGQKPSRYHTLDRFPNTNGDYKPSNCRWATPKQQARNVRTNVLLTINGKTMCISECAEIIGIKEGRKYERIKRGWPHKDAVYAPTQSIKRKGLINY